MPDKDIGYYLTHPVALATASFTAVSQAVNTIGVDLVLDLLVSNAGLLLAGTRVVNSLGLAAAIPFVTAGQVQFAVLVLGVVFVLSVIWRVVEWTRNRLKEEETA